MAEGGPGRRQAILAESSFYPAALLSQEPRDVLPDLAPYEGPCKPRPPGLAPQGVAPAAEGRCQVDPPGIRLARAGSKRRAPG